MTDSTELIAPRFNLSLALALLIAPPVLCFGLDLPFPGITATALTVISLWLTEAVPLPVTGLLVPVLGVLYGELVPAEAFSAFGSDILFLFLGCFLVGRAMEKHGFDRRMAYLLLSRAVRGEGVRMVSLVLFGTSFFLSMWISNTSATAIMCAIAMGVVSSLEDQIPDPALRSRLSQRLLLGVAFAASIGGIATPVGSPPNLIALSLLHQRGIEVSFIEWVRTALPLALLMFVALLGLFEVLFPLRNIRFPDLRQRFSELHRKLGPMSIGEKQIATVFSVMIFLWVMPGILSPLWPEAAILERLSSRLSMSIVGLLGGIATFFLPITTGGQTKAHLDWSETSRLEWGTLLLFGGGLTLGSLLEKSGAAAAIGVLLFQDSSFPPFLFIFLIVLVAILLSEFASNTAAASILIPLALAGASSPALSSESAPALMLALAVTFGASFGFMLPVSTPPNAIVYGTGKVSLGSMRRAGACFDLLGAIVVPCYLLLSS